MKQVLVKYKVFHGWAFSEYICEFNTQNEAISYIDEQEFPEDWCYEKVVNQYRGPITDVDASIIIGMQNVATEMHKYELTGNKEMFLEYAWELEEAFRFYEKMNGVRPELTEDRRVMIPIV